LWGSGVRALPSGEIFGAARAGIMVLEGLGLADMCEPCGFLTSLIFRGRESGRWHGAYGGRAE
jgi:hypothetical protein